MQMLTVLTCWCLASIMFTVLLWLSLMGILVFWYVVIIQSIGTGWKSPRITKVIPRGGMNAVRVSNLMAIHLMVVETFESKPQMRMSRRCERKSQTVIKVSRTLCLGTVTACATFHGNLSNSCPLTDWHCRPKLRHTWIKGQMSLNETFQVRHIRPNETPPAKQAINQNIQ